MFPILQLESRPSGRQQSTTFYEIQNAEMSDDDLDSFFASMNSMFAEAGK